MFISFYTLFIILFHFERAKLLIIAVKIAQLRFFNAVIKKATPDADGLVYEQCSRCGKEQPVTPLPKANGYALTERQKALNAYAKYLSYSKTYVLKYGTPYVRFGHGFTEYKYNGTKASSTDFAIMYINNDDIPELIVRGDVGGYKSYGVYTYKNGKVQFVYGEEGAIFRGCYNKTGYFVSLEDLEACPYVDYMRDYVQMSGTRATKIYTHKVANGKNVRFWIKGQPVSEAKYTRAIRSSVQNKKMTAVKYYKNTGANRKKVLR